MKYRVLTLSIAAAFSTSSLAGGLDGGVATDPYSLAVGPSSEATFSSNVAVGPAAKATVGDSATALGASSVAGPSSVAVGTGANAYSDKGVSIGVNSTSNGGSSTGGNVAIGYDARISPQIGDTVTGSVVLGSGSRATESNVVSVGSSGSAMGFGAPQPPIYRRIVNVADGVDAHDAATVGQLNSVSAATSSAQSAAGTAQATANTALTAATTAQAGVTALGTRVANLEAIAGTDTTARTAITNITTGATDLTNAKVGTSTIGGVAETATRAEAKADSAQVTASRAELKAEVADGKAAMAQVTASTAETKANAAQTTASAAQLKAAQAWDLGAGLQTRFDEFSSKTGQRLDVIETRMASMSREYRAGIAAAIAGVHSVTAASRSGIGVGVGGFQGQTAVGVALSTDVKQVRISASLQYGNGATAFGAGLSIPVKF